MTDKKEKDTRRRMTQRVRNPDGTVSTFKSIVVAGGGDPGQHQTREKFRTAPADKAPPVDPNAAK